MHNFVKALKSDVCVSRVNCMVRESRPSYEEKKERGWRPGRASPGQQGPQLTSCPLPASPGQETGPGRPDRVGAAARPAATPFSFLGTSWPIPCREAQGGWG